MKEFFRTVNKFYLINSAIGGFLAFSIIAMFLVQFSVEGLQDEIVKTESEIAAYEDEIQLLEVEWVYLTRPERLRTLASRYLQNNGYALASQIKNEDQLEKYHLATYQKEAESQPDNQVSNSI